MTLSSLSAEQGPMMSTSLSLWPEKTLLSSAVQRSTQSAISPVNSSWKAVSSLILGLVVGFVEMFTVSDTGLIGMLMNVISTSAFCCTAAVIYKKKHTLQGAILGLVCGTLVMTVVMLLWNYLITPIYMGYPREAVAKMLLPAFLPFNLVKAALNSAITMLLYKPLVTALRRSGMVEASSSGSGRVQRNFAVIAGALFVIATAVVVILVLSGKI